jgi:hypothetical protein
MDFLLFLTPINKGIVQDLVKAKFRMTENAAICKKNEKYYGFLVKTKELIVCTENILKQTDNPRYWINQTVTHEAVHAAQHCKGRVPLGIGRSNMPLPFGKLNYLISSTTMTTHKYGFDMEHEAYFLEDNPHKVRAYIRKFCF